MRYLTKFNQFDFSRFSSGKEYLVVETAPWQDFQNKQILGTVVTVAIAKDSTNYGEGITGTNRFEKIRFRVKKQVSVPADVYVIPVNPVARVFGDYNNQLSVTCDDIRILEPKAQK